MSENAIYCENFSYEEVNSMILSIWNDLLPYINTDLGNTFVQVLLTSEKFCSLYTRQSLESLLDVDMRSDITSFLSQFCVRVVATFTMHQERARVFNSAVGEHVEVYLSELLVYIVLILGYKFTGDVESAWFKYFQLLLHRYHHH